MIYIGAIIAVLFIALTAYGLYKKLNPQGVLLIVGLLMMTGGLALGLDKLTLAEPTGTVVFDLFKTIRETFSSNVARVGLMIMTIGGYVAYMKQIKASDALVYVSMKPLSLVKKYPYVAACIMVPIGQMLFIATPSAAGLGLLLSVSIFPVLVNLGVSRLTAASVICACTVFDMGPGSANTAKAAELVEMTNVYYFIEHQLPMAIVLTAVMMVLYYFSSKYFDKRDMKKGRPGSEKTVLEENFKANAPLVYALLPILPLALLIIFSKYVHLFDPPIDLDTTTAMFISLMVGMIFEAVRTRSFKAVFAGLKSFWDGMGKMFTNVITLIVAAEVFAKGLISLGFIEALVQGSTHIGLSGAFIGILITIMIFLAAMLMGSGNASFFSFGPLIPGIASQLNMSPAHMILPMQLSSSMGRATSPIAGVVIAIADIAGVSPIDLAKRNLIPLAGVLIVMLVYNYAF